MEPAPQTSARTNSSNNPEQDEFSSFPQLVQKVGDVATNGEALACLILRFSIFLRSIIFRLPGFRGYHIHAPKYGLRQGANIPEPILMVGHWQGRRESARDRGSNGKPDCAVYSNGAMPFSMRLPNIVPAPAWTGAAWRAVDVEAEPFFESNYRHRQVRLELGFANPKGVQRGNGQRERKTLWYLCFAGTAPGLQTAPSGLCAGVKRPTAFIIPPPTQDVRLRATHTSRCPQRPRSTSLTCTIYNTPTWTSSSAQYLAQRPGVLPPAHTLTNIPPSAGEKVEVRLTAEPVIIYRTRYIPINALRRTSASPGALSHWQADVCTAEDSFAHANEDALAAHSFKGGSTYPLTADTATTAATAFMPIVTAQVRGAANDGPQRARARTRTKGT
ncbi:hypothetical protein DFH27DRAFT_614702 [Peziza echinospora]|nr:hypothetical protein DFH27DRAFT_614702 [Peziza echinospora]